MPLCEQPCRCVRTVIPANGVFTMKFLFIPLVAALAGFAGTAAALPRESVVFT